MMNKEITLNEQTEVTCSMNKLYKYNDERKKPDTKHILCPSVSIKFKNKDTDLVY